MTDFDGTRPRSAYGKLTPDEEIAYLQSKETCTLRCSSNWRKKKQFELEARRIMSQAPKNEEETVF